MRSDFYFRDRERKRGLFYFHWRFQTCLIKYAKNKRRKRRREMRDKVMRFQ